MQLKNKKKCPLDPNEHPDLQARCAAGEWIPSKREVDSFRLMDDYIDDDITMQLKNKKKSIPACNSVECLTKTAASSGGPPDHPVDYAVADFGLDHDMVRTLSSIKDT